VVDARGVGLERLGVDASARVGAIMGGTDVINAIRRRRS